jgi:hypothetical protein
MKRIIALGIVVISFQRKIQAESPPERECLVVDLLQPLSMVELFIEWPGQDAVFARAFGDCSFDLKYL